MSLTRDLTRPLTRDLTRDLTGIGTTRYLTELPGVASHYFNMPALTLPGNWRVAAEFSTGTSQSNNCIFGYNHSTAIMINLQSTDRFQVLLSGTTYNTATGVGALDSELHLLEAALVGTTLTLGLDGVEILNETGVTSYTSAMPDIRIGSINSISAPFQGIVSEAKIYSEGSIVSYYKIDQSWAGGSTQLYDYSGNDNHGTAVGVTDANAEKFTLNTETTPDQWENSDKSVIIPIAY